MLKTRPGLVSTVAVCVAMVGVVGCDPNANPTGGGGPSTSVTIAQGGSLEFPAGSLSENATVNVTTASEPLLPLGVSLAGTVIRIEVDENPSRPFQIRLPIPAGTDPERAGIYQIADDGATTLLSTEIDGNEIVATTAHFSRLPGAAAKRIPLQDAEIDGIKAAVGIPDATTDVPTISPPRQGRIVGPEFLAPGQTGLYLLTGFEDAGEASLETGWTVYGDAGLAQPNESSGGPSLVRLDGTRLVAVTATSEGRLDLTVNYTDPFSGKRGFAATSITVAADTSGDLALMLVDGILERNVGEEVPGLFVAVTNSNNGPVTYGWNYGDNSGRSTETEDSTVPIGIRTSPHTYDRAVTFNVVVDATDAGGRTGSLTIPVTVTEEMLGLVIDGPLSTPVATSAFTSTSYTYRFSGGVPAYTLAWELLPTSQRGRAETADPEVMDSVFLSEPGAYLLTATVTDTQGDSTTFTKPVTVTGGATMNLTVSAETLTAAPDQSINFTYSIVGGVLVVNGQRRAYQIEFNWNDGSISTLEHDSNSTRSTVGDTLPHRFAEAGTYAVTARVVDATGEVRERVLTIEVTEDGEEDDDPADDDDPTDDTPSMCDQNSFPPDPECFAVVNITNQGSVSASSVFDNDSNNFGVGRSVDGDSSSSWFSDGNSAGGNAEVYTWTFSENTDIFLARVETDPEQFEGGGKFGFATVTVRVLDAGGAEIFSSGVIGLSGSRVDISEAFPAGLAGQTVQLVLVGHQNPSCGGFAELRVFGFELIEPDPESP